MVGTRRPSVVLIVLDCGRADHLSCYGYGRETTPFIDRLAAEGVRFTHMITTAPWTLPAHASLFTGLYSSTHGATDEHKRLEPGRPTLGEILGAAGYATAGFCANPWVAETGLKRGFEYFFDHRPRVRRLARAYFGAQQLGDVLLSRRDSGGRRTTEAFGRWLDRVPGSRPFFAFVHYNEPHLPFRPPPPYDRSFLNGTPATRVRTVNQDCNRYIGGDVAMDAEDFQILTALYDGELRYADHLISRLVDMLARGGRRDDTVLIVTADHGENLGEHGLMSHKFVLTDTLLRIPLVLHAPALLPRGIVSDALVQSTDILPTVTRLLDLPTPPVEGVPLAGPQGLLPIERAFTVSERLRPNLGVFRERYPRFDVGPHDVRKRALRTRTHKYVWFSDGREELYDLVADPGETRDVSDVEPELTRGLRQALEAWCVAHRERDLNGVASPELEGEVKRRLAALGYIEG
jgi:arylsulfatase A-like enzyme